MTNINVYNRFFWLYVEFYKKWYDNIDYTNQAKRITTYKNAIIKHFIVNGDPELAVVVEYIRKNARKDAENYVY